MAYKSKLLYFSRTTLFGGAEISMYDIIRKMNRDKYESVCILPDKSGLLYDRILESKAELIIFRMPFIRKTLNPFLLFWFLFALVFSNIRLIFILKKINPDVVICNSFQDSFYAAIPSKLLRKKLVINIKNILDKQWKKKLRAVICSLFADKVIASSERNADDYRNYSKKKDKVTVIYDGIDVKEFENGYSENDVYLDYMNIDDKAVRILNIGNISELKGQFLLVRAIASDSLKNINVKVFFAGDVNFQKDIEYKEKIIDFIKQEKLQDKIFFMGFVNNIKDYIKYSDIIVHCPVIEEGLGMVVLQGFCYKKIVIGTDIGGIPEMIEDKVTGFLCRPEPEDVARRISSAISNMDRLEEIRQNAYIKLKELFTLEEKVKKTEKIYGELLNR